MKQTNGSFVWDSVVCIFFELFSIAIDGVCLILPTINHIFHVNISTKIDCTNFNVVFICVYTCVVSTKIERQRILSIFRINGGKFWNFCISRGNKLRHYIAFVFDFRVGR